MGAGSRSIGAVWFPAISSGSPPATAFLPTPAMLHARANHTSTLLDDGRVLVAGGVGADGQALGAAEIYDPQTNSWIAAASMYRARAGHTATALFDGRIVLAGGDDAGAPIHTLELFDPYEGVFTRATARLTTPRTGHAAALSYDGLVVIAGGFAGAHALASVDVYDPYEDVVTGGAALSTARSRTSARISGLRTSRSIAIFLISAAEERWIVRSRISSELTMNS